jgi:TadE-like protein
MEGARRLKMKTWRRIARGAEGSEIAEAALVLPLVFTLLLAIIWFAQAFSVYSTITYAAREGAQVAAVGTGPSCATCSPTAPTAGDVYTRISQVLNASHIDPTRIQTYTPTPTPALGNCPGAAATNTSNQVTVYSNVQLNAPTSATNPPACGAVISFQYPFTFFYLPFTSLNKQTILLKAVAQIQGEN